MKWIKIKSDSVVPKENLIATDGKDFGIQFNGYRHSTGLPAKGWLYYILLQDLEMPDTKMHTVNCIFQIRNDIYHICPDRSKCKYEDSKQSCNPKYNEGTVKCSDDCIVEPK